MTRRVLAMLALCIVVGAGCGSSSKSGSGATTTAAGASSSGSKLTGALNVFAASSLTDAFTDVKTKLEGENSGLSITNNYAGSQALVTQIQQGAPADVFASASDTNMQTLVDAGLVETPQVFAKNILEIAVAPGNPKNIKSLADTEKSGVTLVLGDPTVPAGKYARQAYQKAGLPEPQPASNELDVKSVMTKLTAGEADAVVVYVTDVQAAGDQVEGVPIPDDQNVVATYPIAAVKASKNLDAARAYIEEIVGTDGQAELKSKGFLPPGYTNTP
ncbi:MAG TPA: molybdate ABC transporter substrate-binding protein [Acidimicrobiia bacterium]|jgi:molybdate transport system substrate-binding protein|nr:molybdate ABC transporter substrate-binding protein [Acidimicrobiia bacterium]